VTRVDPIELAEARNEGFLPATAEKVIRLLRILEAIQSHPETSGRFTLKGGTALNLFYQERVPRLSVDVDLMMTGFPDASPGSSAQDEVVKRMEAMVRDDEYKVRTLRSPAASTLHCQYRNLLGAEDLIKIDLDLLNRLTILPAASRKGPSLFDASDLTMPTVSEGELLGQKLTAVAYRAAPRDLYDMHLMLAARWQDRPRARACYLAYSLLNDLDWYRLD
jgi:predicted nucleotidyltransferase component of viral defense system